MRIKLLAMCLLIIIAGLPFALQAQNSQIQLKMMKMAYDNIMEKGFDTKNGKTKPTKNLESFLEVYKNDIPNTKKDNTMRKNVRKRIKELKRFSEADKNITKPEPLNPHKIVEKLSYSAEAIKAGIEGKIIIRLTIDKNGNPKNTEIIKGLHQDLDQNALKIAQTLKFKPGTVDGKPVAMDYTLPPITYHLKIK